MTDPLVADQLSEPNLQFDYNNRRAVSDNPFVGLKNFGPYDADERRRVGIRPTRAIVVGRSDRPNAIDRVVDALTMKRLGKLHDVFTLEFVAPIRVEATTLNAEAGAYRRAIQEWFDDVPYERDIDIAIVLHEDEQQYRGESPYYASKAAFMRQGMPTQSIRYDNVATANMDAFRNYYLANILTACYAKIGGVPWVVQAAQPHRPEITIGVASTAVWSGGSVERYVGISTIFRENGAFALWDTTPAEQDWEKYQQRLQKSVISAIQTYETRENKHVTRIACHVSGKRAGRRETEAIASALATFTGRTIVADIVHVTDDAPLWLFDGADASLLPTSGLLTHLTLDGSSALMHTEGRGSGSRFLTRPLRLRLHSDMPATGCLDIYQHLYDLRWMSWRGVRTASRPVSVVYPQKMARLLAYLHKQEDVDALDILPRLKDKAWFL